PTFVKVIHRQTKVIHKLSKRHSKLSTTYPQVKRSLLRVIHSRSRTCVRRGGGGGRTSVWVAGRLKDSYKFLKLGSLFSNVQRYPTSSNVLHRIPNVLQSNPPSIKRPPTSSSVIQRNPKSINKIHQLKF